MLQSSAALLVEPVEFGWKLCGEIDAATAPRLLAALSRAEGVVVLDLSEVTFIDSSGLRVFIELAHRIGSESFVLREPSKPFRRLLELTGLDATFTIQTRPPRASSVTAVWEL